MKRLPPPLDETARRLGRSDYNDLLSAVTELQALVRSREAPRTGEGFASGRTRARVTARLDVRFGMALVLWGRVPYATEASVRNTLETRAYQPVAGDTNIAVADGPIAQGTSGTVVIAGLAWCEVEILDVGHRYVAIGPDGTPVTAAAGGWGWMVDPGPGATDHPGTGKRWCLVRLPAGGGGGAPAKAVYIRSQASAGKLNVSDVSMGPDVDASPNWDAAAATHTAAIFLGTSPISG